MSQWKLELLKQNWKYFQSKTKNLKWLENFLKSISLRSICIFSEIQSTFLSTHEQTEEKETS